MTDELDELDEVRRRIAAVEERVFTGEELRGLLDASADRAVDAVGLLQRELADVRRELADDRRRDDERFKEMRGDIRRIEKRCGALVVEREGPDGETEVVARPAGLGRLGIFLALIGALTPITLGVLEVLKS